MYRTARKRWTNHSNHDLRANLGRYRRDEGGDTSKIQRKEDLARREEHKTAKSGHVHDNERSCIHRPVQQVQDFG